MSVKLKSRQNACINGFRFEQKETGWKSWLVNPNTLWDFNQLVSELVRHRRSNPRFKLETDPVKVADEVDEANALRMTTIPGGENYYIRMASASFYKPLSQMAARLSAAAAAGAKVVAGIGVLTDWLGSGLTPVEPKVSEERARICSACPKNKPGDLTSWFTQPASEHIRSQMEIRNNLRVGTPFDDKLGVCEVCACPLKLKVHTPMDHVLDHTSYEVKKNLDPNCWILKG